MTTLSLRRDPVRLLFSGALWASAGYLLSYLVAGWVLAAIVLASLFTAGLLSLTLAGVPVLIAAAVAVRWCANAERFRLRTVRPEPVTGRYRDTSGSGILAQVRTRWSDASTWRDLAYLVGLFPVLVTLDFAVLTIWLLFLAGISLPAWYQYPRQTWGIGVNGSGPSRTAHGVQLGYFPNGPNSHGAWGLYVDTLPKALLVAVVCLVLFLLFNYVLVATARLHAAIARALLHAPQDPLKKAKEVLDRRGPLAEFIPDGPG